MAHDLLAAGVKEAGYDLSAEQMRRLRRYIELVERDRERFDLTAIRRRDELVRRQVGESLAMLRVAEENGLAAGARLSDVGSGGGVPGIPIAIARPDLKVVLIEGSTRKAGWLEEACRELEIEVEVVALRAEQAGRDVDHRERSDVVMAKAVGRLVILLELAIPLLKTGGLLVAAKGSRLKDEIAEAGSLLDDLSVEIVGQRQIAGRGERPVLVVARKLAATAERFPRSTPALARRAERLKREKE
jgi:16S rRNA (guanine527-N7)-methyltransferase